MAGFIKQGRPKYTYFDFKAGKCSDLEYFRSAYGGTVTKHYSVRDVNKTHPFFVINREIKEGTYKYYEIKVYDLARGLLNKEKAAKAISNTLYWEGDDDTLGYKDDSYLREYVQFLVDTYDFETSKKRSK